MAFIINGEKISDEVIEEEFESIKEHYLNMGEAVCCDRDEEFWAFARENVVNRVLLEQASVKEFGEVADAEVDAKFKQIVAEHGTEDAFYENTGFNRGDEFMLRRKVKSGIMVDRYLEKHLDKETAPTTDDLKAFYEENISKYMKAPEVAVSQLFVEPSSHEAAKEAFENLFEARKQILEGADFMEIAKQHSSLAGDEIDMGFVRQGENMPEMEAQVFSMVEGEVSPILATPFGFHIFKVTERKEPAPVPMEEIPDLAQAYLAKKREDNINAIIDKLKDSGNIEEIEEQPAA